MNFIDSSNLQYSVNSYGDVQIDTAQSVFGGASGLFDGNGDYLTVINSADWDFGTGDFTIDLRVRFNVLQNCGFVGHGYQAITGQKFDWGLLFNSNQLLFYKYTGSIEYVRQVSWNPNINTWYHIAVVRNGNNLYFFVDGNQIGTTQDITGLNYSDLGASNLLYIGYYQYGASVNAYFNGWIDELRISKGIARWTTNFTPPTEAYIADSYIKLLLHCNSFLSGEEQTLSISENSNIQEFSKNITENESLSINESSLITEYSKFFTENESLSISEDVDIHNIGIIDNIFNTDLRTLVSKIFTYTTHLATALFIHNTYKTKLYLKCIVEPIIFKTDLRVRFDDYDSINIGSLDDFKVYLDGNEIKDVDYNTLRIVYNLNSTPSTATFILARRFDNFNYKLDGTYSRIDNENKIVIYDGNTKLFTGYITQIQPLSQNDVVQVIAEDIRYRFSRISLNIEYGGKYQERTS